MIGNFVANMMIKPAKSPVFGNPEEFGLEYEEVTFQAADGVKLSGWLIKGGKNKVIIQSHFGLQCSRSGYTREGKGRMKGFPTDIEFLNQGKYLAEAGYTVLMYDFRNHGNSELGTRPWVTWGPDESKDVIAAVNFISNHPDYKESQIGLFSICMGGSATTLAYGLENGLSQYKNIKAMIFVQPIDYANFTKAMGMPNFFLKRCNKVIEKRTGIDFMTNTFKHNAKDITVPTMVIQNENDSFTNKDFVNQFYNDLKVEKDILWLELPIFKAAAHNRAACYDWIGKNPEKILEWFGKYLK